VKKQADFDSIFFEIKFVYKDRVFYSNYWAWSVYKIYWILSYQM